MTATAFAPASVSNLGPGFDALGLAVSTGSAPDLGDRVRARRAHGPDPVRIVVVTGDGGRLPREAERNTAGIAARETLRAARADFAVELELEKGLPLGSGLGSSAASAVAAACAVNALLDEPLSAEELIGPCLAAEAAVSGRHADNVAPALLGGLVLVRSLDPIDVVRLPVPAGWWVAVVTPALEVATRHARAVLPASVPLAERTRNAADLAAMIHALHAADGDLLARAMHDPVVVPARLALIPGGEAALAEARMHGAFAASVSGAGPSLFALATSAAGARRAAQAMVEAFGVHAGLAARGAVARLPCPGARVVA